MFVELCLFFKINICLSVFSKEVNRCTSFKLGDPTWSRGKNGDNPISRWYDMVFLKRDVEEMVLGRYHILRNIFLLAKNS